MLNLIFLGMFCNICTNTSIDSIDTQQLGEIKTLFTSRSELHRRKEWMIHPEKSKASTVLLCLTYE